MCSFIFICLLLFDGQVLGKDTIRRLADRCFENLIQRALETSSRHHRKLDAPTLGKVSRPPCQPCAILPNSKLGMASGSLASLMLKIQALNRVKAISASGCDEQPQPQPAALQRLGRRSFTFALGSIVMPAVHLASAVTLDRFTNAPEGLRYYDFMVGSGDTALQGDVIKVTYSLKLPGNSPRIVEDKFLEFALGSGEALRGWNLAVLGGGQMPAMKVGGIRNVLVPAELAYGTEGAYCKDIKEECLVPPDSTIQLTITLKAIRNRFLTFLEQKGAIPAKRDKGRPVYCESRYYIAVAGGNSNNVCETGTDEAQWGAAVAAAVALLTSGTWRAPFEELQKNISPTMKADGEHQKEASQVKEVEPQVEERQGPKSDGMTERTSDEQVYDTEEKLEEQSDAEIADEWRKLLEQKIEDA